VESGPKCRDRATARYEDICNSSYRLKLRTIRYTNGGARRMSNAQALIFVAAVVIAVALLLAR
jgi:hypothetical protein